MTGGQRMLASPVVKGESCHSKACNSGRIMGAADAPTAPDLCWLKRRSVLSLGGLDKTARVQHPLEQLRLHQATCAG
jgi:hypothetical protein